jgi:hypothetical protein
LHLLGKSTGDASRQEFAADTVVEKLRMVEEKKDETSRRER